MAQRQVVNIFMFTRFGTHSTHEAQLIVGLAEVLVAQLLAVRVY